MIRTRYLGLFALTLAVVVPIRPVGAAEPPLRHQHVRAALHELREARNELRNARGDFGGHRDKALRAIDDAEGSLKAMMRAWGEDFRGIDRNPDFYRRHRDFPRLRQTVEDLRSARDELRSARGDNDDLRFRAVRDVDYAVEQIGLVLKFAGR